MAFDENTLGYVVKTLALIAASACIGVLILISLVFIYYGIDKVVF